MSCKIIRRVAAPLRVSFLCWKEPVYTVNEEKRILIDFPLKGEWQFLRPPGHHPYAFDFVMKDPDRKKYHKKSKINQVVGKVGAEHYYCWNQPVYSPVAGEVFQIGRDWADHIYTNIWITIALWFNATYRFKPEESEWEIVYSAQCRQLCHDYYERRLYCISCAFKGRFITS